jgi:hypothetical protein
MRFARCLGHSLRPLRPVTLPERLHPSLVIARRDLAFRAKKLEISGDQWEGDVRPSVLEPKFISKACGHRGADVRPLFEPTRMGTGE